jgi:hypothetical protein
MNSEERAALMAEFRILELYREQNRKAHAVLDTAGALPLGADLDVRILAAIDAAVAAERGRVSDYLLSESVKNARQGYDSAAIALSLAAETLGAVRAGDTISPK